MEITAPGFITLKRLMKYDNTDEAIAAFETQEFLHYNPKLLPTDSGRIIFYEGDAGYHRCEVDVVGDRNRIIVTNNHWHYETTLYDID